MEGKEVICSRCYSDNINITYAYYKGWKMKMSVCEDCGYGHTIDSPELIRSIKIKKLKEKIDGNRI